MHHRLRRLGIGLSLLLVALVAVGCSSNNSNNNKPTEKTPTYPKQVLLIRHGEKLPDKSSTALSSEGVKRAEALPGLFEVSEKRSTPFPAPDFIFAMANEKNSTRPVDTVVPLSKKLNLPINSDYGKENQDKLPVELFENPKYAGKTVLISWRHKALPKLAAKLKAPGAPETWGDDVYDRVWQINYDKDGQATFLDLPQKLMPADTPK
jgi:hypothetical protein